MAIYRTRQRDALTEFFKRNQDRSFSVDEATSRLREETPESAPGRSTVYRLMADLLEAGTIRRFPSENGRQAAYQYAGGAVCEAHLHLKCVRCGSFIHVSEEVSRRVSAQIFEFDQFAIDNKETVLSGVCAMCGRK